MLLTFDTLAHLHPSILVDLQDWETLVHYLNPPELNDPTLAVWIETQSCIGNLVNYVLTRMR
jgi:hypothetical protein